MYVDSYKQAKEFFNDPEVHAFVEKRKRYTQKPEITFHHRDYRKRFGEPRESFDLLISQYAGFVSRHCGSYLKPGGILLANNSHGDASMASLDKNYAFIGVLQRKSDTRYTFSDSNLDSYFIPKKPMAITKQYLERIQRGIGYTKSATAYVFRKV